MWPTCVFFRNVFISLKNLKLQRDFKDREEQLNNNWQNKLARISQIYKETRMRLDLLCLISSILQVYNKFQKSKFNQNITVNGQASGIYTYIYKNVCMHVHIIHIYIYVNTNVTNISAPIQGQKYRHRKKYMQYFFKMKYS